jgi:hypothetical protein
MYRERDGIYSLECLTLASSGSQWVLPGPVVPASQGTQTYGPQTGLTESELGLGVSPTHFRFTEGILLYTEIWELLILVIDISKFSGKSCDINTLHASYFWLLISSLRKCCYFAVIFMCFLAYVFNGVCMCVCVCVRERGRENIYVVCTYVVHISLYYLLILSLYINFRLTVKM